MRKPLTKELAAKKEAFMSARMGNPDRSLRWSASRAGVPYESARRWDKQLDEIKSQSEANPAAVSGDPADGFRAIRLLALRAAAEARKIGKAGDFRNYTLAAAIADDKVTKMRSAEKKTDAKGVEAMTDADLKELTIAIGKALAKGLCAQCRKRRAEVNG